MPQRMAHEPGRCRGLLVVDTEVLIDDLRDEPPSCMWVCATVWEGSLDLAHSPITLDRKWHQALILRVRSTVACWLAPEITPPLPVNRNCP